MRRLAVLVAFAMFAAVCAGQKVDLQVRLVNGKNGKPVRNERVNVWDGPGIAITDLPAANDEGVATISVGEQDTIRLEPANTFFCVVDGRPNRALEFSVAEALKKGIVMANGCGKATQAAQPGVIVLFVRSMTYRERTSL